MSDPKFKIGEELHLEYGGLQGRFPNKDVAIIGVHSLHYSSEPIYYTESTDGKNYWAYEHELRKRNAEPQGSV